MHLVPLPVTTFQCLPALDSEALQFIAYRFMTPHLLHLRLSFQVLFFKASQFMHFLPSPHEKVGNMGGLILEREY